MPALEVITLLFQSEIWELMGRLFPGDSLSQQLQVRSGESADNYTEALSESRSALDLHCGPVSSYGQVKPVSRFQGFTQSFIEQEGSV